MKYYLIIVFIIIVCLFYIYENYNDKKIALCFLIYDKINHEELWYNWLKNVDKNKYNIYIHYKENKPLKYFEKYKIKENIPTSWADISLVLAQNLLYKEALKDKDNKHFIFISGSCIPIKIFNYVYNYLNPRYSYFNIMIDKNIYQKCNKALEFVDKKYIKKASMNSILNRKHTLILLKNEYLIKNWFTNVDVPDEHAYITLLYYFNLQHNIKITNNLSYSTTFTGWPDMSDYKLFDKSKLSKNQPNEYDEICNEELEYLVKSESLFARKFNEKCNLKYLYKLLSI